MVAEWPIFGKREQQQPEPPRRERKPVTWAELHDEELHRLLFAKYLLLTGRLDAGRQDR